MPDMTKLIAAAEQARKLILDELESLIDNYSYGGSGQRKDLSAEGEEAVALWESALDALNDALR
jgi:hypothetical protein